MGTPHFFLLNLNINCAIPPRRRNKLFITIAFDWTLTCCWWVPNFKKFQISPITLGHFYCCWTTYLMVHQALIILPNWRAMHFSLRMSGFIVNNNPPVNSLKRSLFDTEVNGWSCGVRNCGGIINNMLWSELARLATILCVPFYIHCIKDWIQEMMSPPLLIFVSIYWLETTRHS